jgi:hypothetical protein
VARLGGDSHSSDCMGDSSMLGLALIAFLLFVALYSAEAKLDKTTDIYKIVKKPQQGRGGS